MTTETAKNPDGNIDFVYFFYINFYYITILTKI